MKIMINLPIPVIKALRKVGQDINDARRRRRITIELMAERAGLSRATIGKIEKGDPTTSMGGYASVLFVLGMEDDVDTLRDYARKQNPPLELDDVMYKLVTYIKNTRYDNV